MKRAFLAGAGATYLLMAVVAGFAMKAVLPALNPLGIAYAGLTWPIALGCTAIGDKCSAIPPQRYAEYLFTFDS